MAAGGGTGNVGTHYEQLIAKLMESGGDPSKYHIQHGSIYYFFLVWFFTSQSTAKVMLVCQFT